MTAITAWCSSLNHTSIFLTGHPLSGPSLASCVHFARSSLLVMPLRKCGAARDGLAKGTSGRV
eukprot:2540133-Alexandrium_andersonii.AAC.1